MLLNLDSRSPSCLHIRPTSKFSIITVTERRESGPPAVETSRGVLEKLLAVSMASLELNIIILKDVGDAKCKSPQSFLFLARY